ncbi:MATE family efflux transporter [Oceanobacillus kapialis]|uniref:Probable multidrug resistance protein NorM n=1 Tax=Oceanobacillus kapialis TaxID=481353 RepID=A0ABW5PWK4_9BACI
MQGDSTLHNNSAIFSQRKYLNLAIPLIISGISTPILGAVDTAVIGRIPDPASIGGVAIGAVIFNTMYWLLGFLRTATSGFTAQAEGAGNQNEVLLAFLRPTLIALFFGLFFALIQKPILMVALFVIGGNETVSALASDYFSIRIWGAPFILLSYVIIGWLIGREKVRLALAVQVFMNVLNIILDIYFVIGLEMGVKGVAYATLIAEVSAVSIGAFFILRTYKNSFSKISASVLLAVEPLKRMLLVNRDLFLRTICLLAMTGMFTSLGASMGEVVLAANAILLQIHYIIAYFFSGFANASSILIGKGIGSGNKLLYHRAYTLSASWGLGAAILSSFIIVLFGDMIVGIFTVLPEVQVTAMDYMVWMVVFPLFGFWGLQLEGIFTGATEAGYIRNAIMLALIIFLLVVWLLVPPLENHGVWLAFVLFSLGRSLFLWMYVPKLNQKKKMV